MRRRTLLILVALLMSATSLSAQTTTFTIPPGSLAPPVILFPASGVAGSGFVTAPQLLCPDGTALLPSCGAFTSEPTLGFWRSSAANVTLQGALTTTGAFNAPNIQAAATGAYTWVGRGRVASSADGIVNPTNNANTIGATVKVDALPTISSGTGTGIAVTAGSTPLAGSLNVGTVAPGTVIVVNFNGTAFPSAPFCQVNDTTTALLVRAQASTTQLTLTSAGFTASDILTWLCVSSK